MARTDLVPLPNGESGKPASLAESFAGADPQADAERLRGLRRMKVVALSFLVGATALVIGSVQCFLTCTYHAPEVVAAPALAPDPVAGGVPIATRTHA